MLASKIATRGYVRVYSMYICKDGCSTKPDQVVLTYIYIDPYLILCAYQNSWSVQYTHGVRSGQWVMDALDVIGLAEDCAGAFRVPIIANGRKGTRMTRDIVIIIIIYHCDIR